MGKQPESKVSTAIMKAWRRKGAFCFKIWGNDMQMSGVPDVGGSFLGWSVWCETKMPGNKTSEIQNYRINQIRSAGGLVVIAYSVSDAVQMLEHIESGDHSRVSCKCLYSEIMDLENHGTSTD